MATLVTLKTTGLITVVDILYGLSISLIKLSASFSTYKMNKKESKDISIVIYSNKNRFAAHFSGYAIFSVFKLIEDNSNYVRKGHFKDG